jgi:hypothetical protein
MAARQPAYRQDYEIQRRSHTERGAHPEAGLIAQHFLLIIIFSQTSPLVTLFLAPHEANQEAQLLTNCKAGNE